MALEVFYAYRAERDLDEVMDYLAKDNPEVSKRFHAATRETCARLTDMPRIAGRWESANPKLSQLRVWPVHGFENWLIFFQITPQAIIICRILHGARDIESLLEGS